MKFRPHPGILLFLSFFLLCSGAYAAEPLKVVATFSILGDMAKQIGGDRIAVTTLVGPNGDAHVYQPNPADARAVANAQVVIVNGLGFEGWIDRLIAAAGYKGTVATATKGIDPLENAEHHDDHSDAAKTKDDSDHDHADPHAWQSLTNARSYIQNIADALAAADPSGSASYFDAATRFQAELSGIENDLKTAMAKIPRERRKIVTSHDAFGYFAKEYDIDFLAPVGMSTESEASAADVARLIQQIRRDEISAVFVENVSDKRLLQQISRETGAKIGGTLYSDALSDLGGPAATYAAMMKHNIRSILGALSN
jgi:zinc/manganese transport system substrate-binding protein